jgi:hypothetical protein
MKFSHMLHSLSNSDAEEFVPDGSKNAHRWTQAEVKQLRFG